VPQALERVAKTYTIAKRCDIHMDGQREHLHFREDTVKEQVSLTMCHQSLKYLEVKNRVSMTSQLKGTMLENWFLELL